MPRPKNMMDRPVPSAETPATPATPPIRNAAPIIVSTAATIVAAPIDRVATAGTFVERYKVGCVVTSASLPRPGALRPLRITDSDDRHALHP